MKSRESYDLSKNKNFYESCKVFFVAFCAVFYSISSVYAGALPDNYQQVEYIQATGTQYFDTGIVGKSGVSVEAKFMLANTSNGSLLGNRQTGETRFWPAMWWNSSGVFYWNATINLDSIAQPSPQANTLYTTYFVSNSSGWTFDVNGERVSQGTAVGNNANTMWMFGTNDGRSSPSVLQYPFQGKVYYAKIWENGTLVRDFIPAKDPDGKFGMYDLVNNNFYKSASSTELTGGNPVIGSACNNNAGTLAVQQNLAETGIIRHKGCFAADGTWPYSDDGTVWLNIFFPVEPSTNYTYTTTTAGTRDGIFEYNSIVNPDDYTTANQLPSDRTIQTGTTTGKYASGTFTTSANAKMIMFYGSNNWPTSPTGLQIYPTNRPIGTVYCDTLHPANQIKIATTKYNEDAFADLVTTLNSAITKVTNVVDTTVAQATSIGTLATTKQDRPADGDCPAGRKCLLVTGTDGKPHWYLIQE